MVLHYVLTTSADEVRVRLYTVAGRKIFESKSAPTGADVNAFVWDGRDDNGNPVANGTYLLHMKASGPTGDAETRTRVVKIQ
jgi:flagellar hook assembly protein FlgD